MKLRRVLFAASILLATHLVQPAAAQQVFVIYSDGVEGGSLARDYEGASDVYGYLHEVALPIDPATGRVSGSPTHAPIQFTKKVDKASPLLMQFVSNRQAMSELQFDFQTVFSDGRVAPYYRITLQDVMITRVTTLLGTTDALVDLPMPGMPVIGEELFEIVSAIYGEITWHDLVNDVSHTSSWEASLSTAPGARVDDHEITAEVFPNPFNTSATLTVDLPDVSVQGEIEVAIFDALGRRVSRAVIDGAGSSQQYSWDARDDAGNAVPSGLYFYRVRAGNASTTGGMTLIK